MERITVSRRILRFHLQYLSLIPGPEIHFDVTHIERVYAYSVSLVQRSVSLDISYVQYVP